MQKHKIFKGKKPQDFFNYSKLTIVHEWLLKQRMAQKVVCQGILHIERRFSANEDFEFLKSSL